MQVFRNLETNKAVKTVLRTFHAENVSGAVAILKSSARTYILVLLLGYSRRVRPFPLGDMINMIATV